MREAARLARAMGAWRWTKVAVWGEHSCPPPLTLFVFFRRWARSSTLPLQSAFKSLIESGSRFFVFLRRDLALFLFYFELKQFFFQRFEQH